MLGRRLIYSFIFLLLSASLFAQKSERKDSLVRLLGCDRLEQIENDDESFRKAIGHARFEHNSTLLLCDTALWNVNEGTIRAIGNVKIIQNRTVLSSDKLNYIIENNLAEFRGSVVQLQDKDNNTLRTRYLDYNTKDSLATFIRGGAFRDKDGQVIESEEGSYDSKTKTFNFFWNVNMYTDSILVKTKSLDYNTGTSVALFGENTHAWRDDNMLSAMSGTYDRRSEVFTFIGEVHAMTPTQEAWGDTLVYHRAFNNVDLMGNAELLDTSRHVSAVAGYMEYIDSLQYVRMTRDPAVIAVSEGESGRDTTYVGADVLIYWTVPKCDVPEGEIKKAETRLKDIDVDPITEYRRKAAEDAKAAAEAARKKLEEEDPNAAGARDRGGNRKPGPMLPAPWDEEDDPFFPLWPEEPQLPDSLAALPGRDSLRVKRPDSMETTDSLAVSDSLGLSVDSTRIGFLLGLKNVKVFRKDMQVVCDSLAYNDLDSLVRLYRNPVVWNEVRRQYSADSITVVVRNRNLERANLMSNAFIIVQEDSLCFDQIRGAEMMAWFDSTGALKRFDSMGGSSGVFFIEEKGAFATVNKFASKMLTATFKDGTIYDLNYFEEVKSDAYPAVQLSKDERILKGFEWIPEKRPKGPEDITTYTPRPSERERYADVEEPSFSQTEEYFPAYMYEVMKTLDKAKKRKREARAERQREKEEKAAPGSEEKPVETAPETPKDTLAVAPEAPKDTQAVAAVNPPSEVASKADTNVIELGAGQIDSLLAGHEIEALRNRIPADPKEELRARQRAEKEAKKAEKEKARQAKMAAKEERWAALDAKDAEKAAKKAAKDLEKKRARTLKMLRAKEKREAKEQKALERYKARYEKKKARSDARNAKKGRSFEL